MSEVKVNKISPRSGTTVTLGDSGDTIAITSGASLTGFTSTGIDDNATSTSLFINSSNRVTVGTDSGYGLDNSADDFVIANILNDSGMSIVSNASNSSSIFFTDTGVSSIGKIVYSHSSDDMKFTTNNAEAMRIDSSGNVLVSTTDPTPSENNDVSGISLRSNGQVNVSVDGGAGLDINRKTSDGQILRLRKDGVDVGSIGSSPNFNIQRASGAGFNFGTTNISPLNSGVLSDNTIDLGFSSYRWNDLYLGGNIYLGGTGSANALDDYEEGTWTPSAETGTITFSNPKYTKIGRQVFLTGSIQSFSNTTTAINVKILGVPFQVDGEASGGVMARYFSGSISGDALTYYMQDNTSQIIFYITANNSNFESLQHADLTSGAAQIYFSISYMTD